MVCTPLFSTLSVFQWQHIFVANFQRSDHRNRMEISNLKAIFLLAWMMEVIWGRGPILILPLIKISMICQVHVYCDFYVIFDMLEKIKCTRDYHTIPHRSSARTWIPPIRASWLTLPIHGAVYTRSEIPPSTSVDLTWQIQEYNKMPSYYNNIQTNTKAYNTCADDSN